jgi:hypothetical protein
MVVLATVAALVLSAPASAQEPSPQLYEAAPAQELGTTAPSDGGRSIVLLGLALVALAGAGVLAVLAVRRPAREPSNSEVVDQALAALAAGEPPVREPVEPPAKPTRRFRIKAPAQVDVPEPAEPKCAWRPRVVADPPLPAFGPGAHTGSPSVPPPPD